MKLILKQIYTGRTITIPNVIDTALCSDPDTGEELAFILFQKDGFYIFNPDLWIELEKDYVFHEFPEYKNYFHSACSFIRSNPYLKYFPYSFEFFLYSVFSENEFHPI